MNTMQMRKCLALSILNHRDPTPETFALAVSALEGEIDNLEPPAEVA